MIYLFIWLVGALFCLGLIDAQRKNESLPEKVVMTAIIMILWPFFLGIAVTALLGGGRVK